MSNPREDAEYHDLLEAGLTRAEALSRAAKAAAGLAVGSAAVGAFAGAAAGAGMGGAELLAQPTKISKFPPFNPRVPRGAPTGLPKVVAVNAPAGSEYFVAWRKNIGKAVKDRGFKYIETTFGSDIAKNVDVLEQLLVKGVGVLVIQPQDIAAERAVCMKAIKEGVGVIYTVGGPSTIQIAANQFNVGYTQGVQAVKWIKANLGGQAEVIVFNATQISQSLTPRTTGRIAGLKTGGPGIKVVANQAMKNLTTEEGSQLASTLLQRFPNVNVWLGDDDTIMGVMAVLQAMGKKPTDKIYLSGVNGQANALDAVKRGTLFREDLAFPNGVYEYAMGMLACDYIESRSVPQVMNVKLIPVTKRNLNTFLAADKNPRQAYLRDKKKYVEYLGNISYANRMKKFLPNAVS